jgi:hypothetical protein
MTLEVAASEPCVLLPQQDWMFRLSSTSNSTETFDKLKAKGIGTIISTQREMRPYIDIDMGKTHRVGKISLISPTEPRLKSYSIFGSAEKCPERNPEESATSASDKKSDKVIPQSATFSTRDSIAFFPPLEGRYFRIQLNGDEPQSLVLSGLDFFDDCGPAGPIGILRDPEVSKCDNGGFETGTLSGWTGLAGRWNQDQTAVIMDRINGIYPDVMKVLKIPFAEEWNLPITMPCKGDYVARLGVARGNGQGQGYRLSYKFTVNQQNADFFFRYAFVQENSMHTNGVKNPYFEYKVFRVSDNQVIKSKRIQNQPDNPDFPFLQTTSGGILYRSWSCVRVDLSAFIGQEFIAQFEVAGCSQVEHFGYAYIDGLCTSAQDNTPQTILTGKSKICNDGDYKFSATNSCNAERSVWTVSELNTAKQYPTKTVTKVTLGNPGEINIRDLFNTEHSFDENKTYRITIQVSSECGEGQLKTMDVEVDHTLFKFVDMMVCNGATGEIKVRSALNNCSTCTGYQWSPSFAFVDPYVKNPILNPNFGAICNKKLSVTATDGSGCVFKDEINLNKFDGNIVSVDKDVDKTDVNNGSAIPKSVYCGYEIKVNVNLGTCLQPNKVKVLITTEADPDYSSVAEFQSFNSNGLAVYKTIIPQSLGVNLHSSSNKLTASVIFADYGYPQRSLAVYGDCYAKFSFTLENRFWYYGYWEDGIQQMGNFRADNLHVNASIRPTPTMFIPNTFSPDATTVVNRKWIAHSADNYGYGAYWYRIEAFSRWGNRVFFREEMADHPTVLLHNRFNDHSWIRWDGKIDGQTVESAVFTWYINMETCLHPKKERFDLIPGSWKGDVDVQR